MASSSDSISDSTYNCLGIDHLDEVCEYCKLVEAKWQTLAENLNVHRPTVDQIIQSNGNDVSKCFHDVLSTWLRCSFPTQPEPSWRSLCDALADMGEVALSERIQGEHPCNCDLCNSATVTRHTPVSLAMQQGQNAVDTAKELEKNFEILMAEFLVKKVSEINIHKLRYQISRFFAENGISDEINANAIDIEGCSTPNAVLNYFRRHRFIGYINYSLIKVFQKLAKVPLLDIRIAEYEKNYQHFLEVILAQPIRMIFQQCPDLRFDYPTGIPKFMIKLKSEWKGQSVFELKDLLKQLCSKNSEGTMMDQLTISGIIPSGGSITGNDTMTNSIKPRNRLSKSVSEQSPQDRGKLIYVRTLSCDAIATDKTSGRGSDIGDTEGAGDQQENVPLNYEVVDVSVSNIPRLERGNGRKAKHANLIAHHTSLDADHSVTSSVSDMGGDYENGGQRVESKQWKEKPGVCSTIDVFCSRNVTNSSMQFDYWVPIEDLLYGATVVDSKVFNVHGDHEQTFNWSECGFSLYVPPGSLDCIETCPVAVKALISGRFKFPEGFQLISALYAISPGRKFRKKIKMSIQHCFQIEREEQLKRLCFIKACGTANPSDPYVFEYVDGGTFTPGSQYCDLWQNEFSIYGAGKDTKDSDQQQNNEARVKPQEGSNIYRAHFFCESIENYNLWNYKAVVIRNLNVHIKHMNAQFTESQQVESFVFHFLNCSNSKPAISFNFSSEKKLPKGWHVDPISSPCSIRMEEVDALSTQELKLQANEKEIVIPDLPMRKVRVSADSDCKERRLHYSIPITGIDPEKEINIIIETNEGGAVNTLFHRFRNLFNQKTHQKYWYVYAAVIALILGVLITMVMPPSQPPQVKQLTNIEDHELLGMFAQITIHLRSVCINLELDRRECDEIFDDKTKTYEDQRHEVIALWARASTKGHNWNDLVKALERTGEHRLAELAKKHVLE